MDNEGPINIEHAEPAIPLTISRRPHGLWGIEYDFKTNAIEHSLPNGWGSHRGTFSADCQGTQTDRHSARVYGEVGRILTAAQFDRIQYSCWRSQCSPTECWIAMFAIFNMLPAGLVETTIDGLAMCYFGRTNIVDVTRSVILGRRYSRILRGLTPAGFINQRMRAILRRNMGRFPLIPGPQRLDVVDLPRGVIITDEARTAENWRF